MGFTFTKKYDRLGVEKLNNQGCLMKIVEYIDANNMIVEFQDEHKTRVRSAYRQFEKGEVTNPYYPSVYGIGTIGCKYPSRENGKVSKEYKAWNHIIERCFSKKYKEKHQTYECVTCCEEWLLYENFYEWLHEQENFNKWFNGERWAVDKDILVKGNKTYSPETCCLVPQNVNTLFIKNDINRGNLPIGISRVGDEFQTSCKNPFTNKNVYLGKHSTIKEAFNIYKLYKEKAVKQVANIEYNNGNITKPCYEAMMNYEVEITD